MRRQESLRGLQPSPTQVALPSGFSAQLRGPTKQFAAPGRYFAHHCAQVIFPLGHRFAACTGTPNNSKTAIARVVAINRTFLTSTPPRSCVAPRQPTKQENTAEQL